MIYLALIIWILLLHKLRISDNIFVFLAFGTMALVMGLRSINVGVDTYSYYIIFGEITNDSWRNITSNFFYEAQEVGYVSCMKCISFCSRDYYVFQLIESVVYCWGIAIFIKKNMKNYFLGIILFLSMGLYFAAFNIARQTFAIMLVINSLQFIRNGKMIKACSIILLASTIHITALIFFVVPLCYLIKDHKIVYLLPFVLIMMMILYQPLIHYVADNFDKYQNYYDNTNEHRVNMNTSIVLYATIVGLSLLVFYISTKKESELRIYAIFSLAYVGFVIVGLFFNYIERLGLYFLPFVFLIFENIGDYLRRYNTHIYNFFIRGVYVCFIVYYYLSSLSQELKYEAFF